MDSFFWSIVGATSLVFGAAGITIASKTIYGSWLALWKETRPGKLLAVTLLGPITFAVAIGAVVEKPLKKLLGFP